MAAVTDRGQGFTLEAVLAAMVLLTTIAMAFHLVGITPNTPSTSDASDVREQRAIVDGVLAASVDDGSLQATLRYWDDEAGGFHNTTDGYYVSQKPPTAFGERLERVLHEDGIKYNVYAQVVTNEGIATQPIVVHGTPTDQAVRSVSTVTLLPSDRLIEANGTASSTTLAAAETFYASDALDGGHAAVVRIEVVVWRT